MIDDEHSTARLLRLGGDRPLAPADRAARVRDAVYSDWRAVARRRAMRRRVLLASAVASSAAVIAALAFLTRHQDAPPRPRAVVAHVETVQGVSLLSAGESLLEDSWVETNANTRVGVRLADGTSVRLDSGSKARLVSARVIDLDRGALYIDTGRHSTGLEVRTPVATVRDIGTQFETRLTGNVLTLRVRTGLVELRRQRGEALAARAGTELSLDGGNATTRSISGEAPEWAWAAAVAPVFDIEGQSVAAFLEHVASEQGWSLRYEDARLARDASSILLHGSVAGLQPQEALMAALATCDLAHRVRDGELLVIRRPHQEGR